MNSFNTSENILRWFLSLIYPAVYLLNIYVRLAVVDTVPELCQKGDFFQKKRLKCTYVGVLEFMLTLDKMQYFIVKKVRNLRAEYFESYSSFSYCTHNSVYRVLWSSDQIVDCNILILFRRSTTGLMTLAAQILHTAATPQIYQTKKKEKRIQYSC